jgi:hypothetical protein
MKLTNFFCINMLVPILFLFLVFCGIAQSQSSPDLVKNFPTGTPTQEILDYLFNNTNYSALDAPSTKSPTRVSIGFSINQLLEVDVKTNSFSVNVDLLAVWFDPRLKVTMEDYTNGLRVPNSEKIWKPELLFVNEMKGATGNKGAEFYFLKSYGMVYWASVGVRKFSSEFDLAFFPYDIQKLEVVLGLQTISTLFLGKIRRLQIVGM